MARIRFLKDIDVPAKKSTLIDYRRKTKFRNILIMLNIVQFLIIMALVGGK